MKRFDSLARLMAVGLPMVLVAVLLGSTTPASTQEIRLSPIDLEEQKEILRKAMREQKW